MPQGRPPGAWPGVSGTPRVPSREKEIPSHPGCWPGKVPICCRNPLFDVSDENRALLGGKSLVLGNLDEELPFSTDFFDFVYCSHVLEHLESPIFGLSELQRVGKRGFVEIPSVLLDFLAHHGKTHPKWACWGASAENGVLLFIEKTKAQNRLFLDFNSCWGAFFNHALHGVRLSAPQRDIRAFFWQNQQLLNISASWDKNAGKTVEAMEMRLK